MNVYRKLLSYVPKERKLAYLAVAMTAVGAVLTVSAYFFIHRFLEALIVQKEAAGVRFYATGIVGLLLSGAILYFIAVLLTHIVGFRLETNLRKHGIDGLARASFRFFDLNTSGKTRKIIDDNATETHMIIAHLIPDVSSAILTPILTLVIGYLVNWKVGLILTLLCLIAVVQLMGMTGNKDFMKKYQQSLERLGGETVEYIRGIQVVKVFGATVRSFKALHEAIMSYSDYALTYSMSCKRPFVGFQWLTFGLMTLVIPAALFLPDRTAAPEVLAVQLIMTIFLSGVLATAIMRILYVSMYAYMGTAAVDKLEALFTDMHRDALKFGNRERFDNFDIEFDHVTFGYGEEKVLEDLSFKLREQKSYALVGSSGGGKSTIAKLLSGFYKVDGGCIKIGGVPLEEYSEEAVMKNIAFVFQHSKLFKKSIYENVLIGKPDATREEVLEALRLAGCDSLLEKLKDGADTVIGTEGIFLSGGEKQRIAIARAILKDANIVVLDEAVASVDPENEHELQKAFANLMKGKTVLMIAHRLSSIRSVDEVLVMEGGKLIERGTDAELMAKESRYRAFQELYGQANEWRVRYE